MYHLQLPWKKLMISHTYQLTKIQTLTFLRSSTIVECQTFDATHGRYFTKHTYVGLAMYAQHVYWSCGTLVTYSRGSYMLCTLQFVMPDCPCCVVEISLLNWGQ